VLTMCRMRYTLQYGAVVSKPIAARWAQTALDAWWTPLIQAALAWSSDIVPDLSETLRFIDDTRQASER
jgi:Aminoglycoside adenylyltransferase, C-terminal domain